MPNDVRFFAICCKARTTENLAIPAGSTLPARTGSKVGGRGVAGLGGQIGKAAIP
jgi:hypothetical protein